jgi:hypothetical protein
VCTRGGGSGSDTRAVPTQRISRDLFTVIDTQVVVGEVRVFRPKSSKSRLDSNVGLGQVHPCDPLGRDELVEDEVGEDGTGGIGFVERVLHRPRSGVPRLELIPSLLQECL